MNHENFNQTTWDNATTEGREAILRNYYEVVQTLLGITARQDLEFRNLGPHGTSGDYFLSTGLIRINTRYLQDSNDPDELGRRRNEAMFTVIHETLHEFHIVLFVIIAVL